MIKFVAWESIWGTHGGRKWGRENKKVRWKRRRWRRGILNPRVAYLEDNDRI